MNNYEKLGLNTVLYELLSAKMYIVRSLYIESSEIYLDEMSKSLRDMIRILTPSSSEETPPLYIK